MKPVTPAPMGRRLAALLYDGVLLSGVLFAATIPWLAIRGGKALEPNDMAYTSYLLAVGITFFSWFWIHGGQTLGMRAWKIRLVGLDGNAPGWRQCLVRCLVAIPSASLFGSGYLWILLDREQRSWHDRASGTRMIRSA